MVSARRVGFGLARGQTEFLLQRRIESGDRGGRVVALRRLVEAAGRFPRLVCVGEIAAAVERIVRRRLQVGILAGAGTHAGRAALDARIEQVGERVGGRRRIGP